jgi:putative spermidine/putrescine transport system permease protein
VKSSRDLWLAAPLAAMFTVFVAAPLLLIAFVSLHDDPGLTRFGVAPYLKFASDAYNRGVLTDTLLMSAETVALTILLGYPVAGLYVAYPHWRRVLMFLVVLPLLTSTVVRSFAWVVILGNEGLINRTMLAAGLIDRPIRLLYTSAAVVVALAQIQLPLMVLPLISALSGLDTRLTEASYTLGAGPWRTFRRVVLPLSVPGLLTGVLLVFTGAASALITQTLVGGGQLMYMPFYIYEQAIQAQDFPFAAALAIVLLVSIVVIVTVLNALGRRSRAFVHG